MKNLQAKRGVRISQSLNNCPNRRLLKGAQGVILTPPAVLMEIQVPLLI
jgi:hypothetical protein